VRADDLDVGSEIDRFGANGVEERFEENAAVKPEAEETLFEIGVREIDDRATFFVRAMEPADPIAAFDDAFFEPESIEDGHPRRLEHDPGADGRWLRDALEHDDAMSGAMQEERGGSSRGAAAHDPDVELHTPTRRICLLFDGVNGIGYLPEKHA
jgi:hypothetical protein